MDIIVQTLAKHFFDAPGVELISPKRCCYTLVLPLIPTFERRKKDHLVQEINMLFPLPYGSWWEGTGRKVLGKFSSTEYPKIIWHNIYLPNITVVLQECTQRKCFLGLAFSHMGPTLELRVDLVH